MPLFHDSGWGRHPFHGGCSFHEEQMLYPKNVKSKVTVKTHGGQTLSGALEYKGADEFVTGMKGFCRRVSLAACHCDHLSG